MLPPVTRLYHSSPIGLGTPMVESLTGYIVRLAEAHCVSAGVLYAKEIKALAGKGNIFSFRVENQAGYSTHTINGFGSPAADFVRALETLTGRRDLSFLTLLTWCRVLPSHSLLRRCRAWCESCLYAWRKANQPIYEPLLWALQAVTICPYHRRILRQACPRCERQIGPLDSRSRRDRCSRCGQSLVPNGIDPISDSRMLPSEELAWASWVASALGELLAAAPQITCPPERGLLAQTIRLCVDRVCAGNASKLARLMHVGRGAVRDWQREKTTPGLPLLLNMAYRLGISLRDLLLGSPTLASSRGFVRDAPVGLNARRQRRRTRPGWYINRARGLPNPPEGTQRNPAALRGTGDDAFLPWPSDHLPALSRTLPPDRAALRGIPGEACHRKEGPGRRRGEKGRVRASGQRDKSHTPEPTPTLDQLRLPQPRRGT